MRKYNIAQISFLIACGSALQLAESFIPFPVPVPGLKTGLANISTLLGLALFGTAAGFEVALFRPVITSLTNGTFLSPGMLLSVCGSLAGFSVMALFFGLLGGPRSNSLITAGILGAVTHNAAEVAAAYYWLFPHAAILALAPVLAVAGGVGGYLVGWSSRYVLRKIEKEKLNSFSSFGLEPLKESPAGLTLKDKAKILAAFLLVLGTIFWTSILTYLILTLIVLLLIVLYGETVYLISNRFLRLWGIILFSFALPVVFSPGGPVLWQVSIVKVTAAGFYQGTLFALRLVFLIFISIWIGVTEPSKLSRELAWMLSPLKIFRFSVDRIPRLTSLSLSLIPVVWERMAQVRPKTLKSVLDMLVVFFIGLEGEPAPAGGPGVSPAPGSTEPSNP
ncbi:MAG: Gx transporter family protein [Endomicrobiales bacterium]